MKILLLPVIYADETHAQFVNVSAVRLFIPAKDGTETLLVFSPEHIVPVAMAPEEIAVQADETLILPNLATAEIDPDAPTGRRTRSTRGA